ncbi:MAG: DNA polymerase III subunit delta, partial [Pyrinomonadaceae bacterium]
YVLKDSPVREFNDDNFSLSRTEARTDARTEANTDLRQALAAAEQMPMLSERRVVTLRAFTKLKEADDAILCAYVQRPVNTTILILSSDGLDKRLKLTKLLQEKCTFVEFMPLTDREVITWTRNRLAEMRMESDNRVIDHLVALVGTSLRRLDTELMKLSVAAIPSSRITLDLVDSLIGRSRELSNFALTDHLVSCNRKTALQTLHRLLDDGAEPVMLVGLIASNYRRLALAKELMSQDRPFDEVMREVKPPYGKRDEFLALSRRTSAEAFAHNLARIAETDLAIKTSLALPRQQLELLVCDLTS